MNSTSSDDLLPTIDAAPAGRTADTRQPTLDASTPPTTAPTVSPSRSDTHYHKGAVLGRGGMGEVVVATDRDLQREVVMKTLLPGADQDPGMLRRFVEEAQVTGQLEHPNIVPVHEFGRTAEGKLFFTMKRVRGQDLKKLIQAIRDDASVAARYPLSERLAVFLAITNGVAFAHAHDVIHRDLKPENVMIGEFGEVLVMDWGLAKVVGTEPEAGDAEPHDATAGRAIKLGRTGDTSLTMAGQVVGTPNYMAPEQARGDVAAVDHRADIYALGAILYELLALRRAFTAQTLPALLDKVVRGDYVPPGARRGDPAVPRELVSVVARAMALDPDRRYATVPALAADIRAFLAGQVLDAARYTPFQRLVKWGLRHKGLVAGAAVAVAALGAGVYGMRTYEHRRTERRVASTYDEACQDLAAGRFEAAQRGAIRVVALADDHPHVEALLQHAGARIESERARARDRAGAAALAGPLAEAEAAVAALGPMNDANRAAWYERYSRLLDVARRLVALDPSATSRAALVRAGRALARRLSADGNVELARLMIDEARRAGLPDDVAQVDRWLAVRDANANGRAASIAAGAALEAVDRGTMSHERALEQILALPRHPALVERLILAALEPVNIAQAARILAIDALGRLGDRASSRGYAACPRDAVGQTMCNEEILQPLLQRELDRAAAAMRDGEGQPCRVTTGRALALLLLCAFCHNRDDDGSHEAALCAAALARLGDPAGATLIALKRHASKPGSSLWVRTLHLASLLPLPEPAGELDRDAWFVRALAYEDRASWAEAARCFDRAIAVEPGDDPIAATFRPRVELRRGEPRAAIELATRAVGAIEATIERRAAAIGADPALDADRRSQAIGAMRRGLVPHLRFLHHVQAQGHAALGSPEAALASLDAAMLAEDAKNPTKDTIAIDQMGHELHADRARLLLGLGRTDEASAEIDRAFSAFGRTCANLCLRARILLARTERQAAIASVELALRQAPEYVEALALRAEIRAAEGHAVEAVADYDRLLAIDPNNKAALLARGRIHVARFFAGAGDHEAAARDLERVLELDPASIDAAFELGCIRAIVPTGAPGRALLTRAIDAGHERARAIKYRAIEAVLGGAHAAAGPDLAEAARLLPDDADVLVFEAKRLYAERKLDACSAKLERALALDRVQPEGHFLVALLALESGRREEALTAFDRAYIHRRARWWPSSAICQEHHAMILYGRASEHAGAGRLDVALSDIERAIEVVDSRSPMRARLGEARDQLRARLGK